MSSIILGMSWMYPVGPRCVGATVGNTQMVGVMWFMSSESPCSCLLEMCLHSRIHWHLKIQTSQSQDQSCTLGTIPWFCLVEAWQYLGSSCTEAMFQCWPRGSLCLLIFLHFLAVFSPRKVLRARNIFWFCICKWFKRVQLMNEPSRHCCSNVSDK